MLKRQQAIPSVAPAYRRSNNLRAASGRALFLLPVLAIASFTPKAADDLPISANGVSGTVDNSVEKLLIVDCLLPGRIRTLGPTFYQSPRRPLKTSARDCEVRGGEYVVYDRAAYATSLQVWLPTAKEGDPAAQTLVGEIYEKGLGSPPDYVQAAHWYREAAQQGDRRAQVNLGYLYEKGLGVPKDTIEALKWYRKASGLNEAEATFAAVTPPAAAVPEIVLSAPALSATRGPPAVLVPADSVQPIAGTVKAPAGLRSLTINDRLAQTDETGSFRLTLEVQRPETPVGIVAIDKQGMRTELAFVLVPKGAKTQKPPAGTNGQAGFLKYYALVVGIGDYQHYPRLPTAVRDAQRVSEILRDKYGVEVRLLVNPTRHELLSQLDNLRQRLTAKDNFIIYYAGHGALDHEQRGYWLPVDAERDTRANWISNASIADMLDVILARQVLIVADSIFSYTSSPTAVALLSAPASKAARDQWLRIASKQHSRMVLTSGGSAPVLDSGGGEVSVFADAFLSVLQGNVGVLEGQRLAREVSDHLNRAAAWYLAGGALTARYAPIRYAGHEGGDFLLASKHAIANRAPAGSHSSRKKKR